MTLPRGKAVVRSVSAWGDASSRNRGGFLECAVRPAKMGSQTGLAQRGAVRLAWLGGQTATQNFGRFGFRGSESSGFSSGGHGSGGWHGESTQYGWLGGMFARRSPPRAQYGDERVIALRWRGGTVYGLPFVFSVLLQLERVGSLVLVTMVVFVEVALIGEMFWIVLTPLWSKRPSTGFTLLVLTPVLSHLFTHVLAF
jgi:hypothetical protein